MNAGSGKLSFGKRFGLKLDLRLLIFGRTKMDTYTTVKNRILQLLGEKKMSIHKLAMESAVAPSSIKNILYGKSQNPGIVTIKMLCDGFGISLTQFFDTEDFKNLEQEIK